jgi:hypothetical protein
LFGPGVGIGDDFPDQTISKWLVQCAVDVQRVVGDVPAITSTSPELGRHGVVGEKALVTSETVQHVSGMLFGKILQGE